MRIRTTSFRLTRGGWALLLLCLLMAMGAFNAGLNMVYLLSSLLLAVFGVALVAPVWSIGRLRCRRTVPAMPHAGEPYEIRLALESRRRTAARVVTLTEPLAADGKKASGRRVILRLLPRERLNLAYTGAPRRRGAYPMPPIRWSSRFPFGVAECGVLQRETGELLVYPARGQLSGAVTAALRPHGTRTGAPSRVGLPGEDFRSLREYVVGDSPRWVHWRASAHHNKLYVREMERERSAPVLVVLDSRVPASLTGAARDRALVALERAISFAAEVCRVAMKEGGQATVVAFTPEPTVLGRPALDGTAGEAARYRDLLAAFARLQPSSDETADALSEAAAEAGLAGAWRVMAVTPTEATAASLRPVLGRRGANLYVADSPGFDRIFQPWTPEPEVLP